jgi:hypothetical protein
MYVKGVAKNVEAHAGRLQSLRQPAECAVYRVVPVFRLEIAAARRYSAIDNGAPGATSSRLLVSLQEDPWGMRNAGLGRLSGQDRARKPVRLAALMMHHRQPQQADDLGLGKQVALPAEAGKRHDLRAMRRKGGRPFRSSNKIPNGSIRLPSLGH